MNTGSVRRVLNVGCGPMSPARLHAAFAGANWREIRLDIDERVQPDLVGSMTDMQRLVPDGAFDALWSSHNLEHLHAHEAPLALQEFRRVLNRDGFALINCPDVMAIAQLIVEGRFDQPAYISPAGPICALDMLYGHSRSIAEGNSYMTHKTGFTANRLGRLLLESGFPEAWVFPGHGFDIWAIALMDNADRKTIRSQLETAGLEVPS